MPKMEIVGFLFKLFRDEITKQEINYTYLENCPCGVFRKYKDVWKMLLNKIWTVLDYLIRYFVILNPFL